MAHYQRIAIVGFLAILLLLTVGMAIYQYLGTLTQSVSPECQYLLTEKGAKLASPGSVISYRQVPLIFRYGENGHYTMEFDGMGVQNYQLQDGEEAYLYASDIEGAIVTSYCGGSLFVRLEDTNTPILEIQVVPVATEE